jgi:hypothetical protein
MKSTTAAAPRSASRTAWVTLLIFSVCVLSLLALVQPALAQQPFEAPPVLSAKYLLPPEMISGPLFRVDEQVPTDGLRGLFTLRSDLGAFTVPGRELLKIRIAELPAIQQLNETSKTDVFLSAAATAAARPVDAAVNIVTDPVGTAKALPGGISRFFDRVQTGVESVAMGARDSDKSTDQKAQETAQRVGDATITALGFEQVRRQLAKGLGVDPYTTNPVLAEKLTNTAWVAFSGRLGVNALTTVFVPGSAALSLTSFTSDLVYDTPKADLIVMNKQKMMAIGASEAQAQALLKNQWFSMTVLTSLVTELERLATVRGRPEVIALAATARNEEDARFLASSVHLLGRLNVTGVSIKEVKARGTVIGVTPAGALVVPALVDYVSWTERIGSFAGRPDLQGVRRSIWLTGRMSGAAQRGFTRLGWTLQEAPSVKAP